MPVYNESENIERVIDEWYPIVEKHNANGTSRLVVINDGSTDDTKKILCELTTTRPLLQLLSKENTGHGATVLFGYQYSIDANAKYIFQTDSDGQTNPAEFERFWKIRSEKDAIFGNRVVRGDGQARAFVEKVLCRLLNCVFGVRIPDANAPFRLMNKEYLEKYIALIPKNYYLPNVMLTVFGAFYHDNISFVEISFRQRQGGENSINAKKIIKTGIKSLRDFFKFKSMMRRDICNGKE